MIFHERFRRYIPEFDELMISWNGIRPRSKNIDIFVRVYFDEEWSDWYLYAVWGGMDQKSCNHKNEKIRIYQDVLQILDGKKGVGFEVRADGIDTFHVYTNSQSRQNQKKGSLTSVELAFEGLSQMRLNHPRNVDLCSPTATAAVIRYLLASRKIDPTLFAEKVKDYTFDIYGNWVLNVAEASNILGNEWNAWVEKLNSFDEIYERLLQNLPVVVSVRGPLLGSAKPYAKGHLLVVIGFDPKKDEVICMDPAFETDEKTRVRYDLNQFLAAWKRRENLAYLFEKKFAYESIRVKPSNRL